jgi:hypothetical protein
MLTTIRMNRHLLPTQSIQEKRKLDTKCCSDENPAVQIHDAVDSSDGADDDESFGSSSEDSDDS